jgi:hypothetical protein
MAASEAQVRARVTDILNLQTPGSWTATVASTNLDRNELGITQAVLEGAMMIAKAILANPTHVHRNLFISATPVALTSGAELPDMAGEMDLIEIQPYTAASWITGVPRTPQQIDSFLSNTSSLYGTPAHNVQGSPLTGYYSIDNGRVKFTGAAARIYSPLVDRATVTTIIPDEYEDCWVWASVAGTPKEGDNMMGIVGHYSQLALSGLKAISEMSVIAPMSAHGDAV